MTYVCKHCGASVVIEAEAMHLALLTLVRIGAYTQGFFQQLLFALVAADQNLCAKCCQEPS